MLGTLPGYWLGADDGRPSSPFLSKTLWHQRLLDAGLSGADIVLDDYPEPADCTTLIMSRNSSEAANHASMNGANHTNGANSINNISEINGVNGVNQLNGAKSLKPSTVTLV